MAATTPEQLVAALALYKEVTAATDILPDFREAMQRAITRLIDPQASDRRRGSISSCASSDDEYVDGSAGASPSGSASGSLSGSAVSVGGGDDEDGSVDISVDGSVLRGGNGDDGVVWAVGALRQSEARLRNMPYRRGAVVAFDEKKPTSCVIQTYDSRQILVDVRRSQWRKYIYVAVNDEGNLYLCVPETRPKKTSPLQHDTKWKGTLFMDHRRVVPTEWAIDNATRKDAAMLRKAAKVSAAYSWAALGLLFGIL